MSPDRWRHIETLFHRALERTPGERAAFLEEACAGDSDLHRRVASLLEQSPEHSNAALPTLTIFESTAAAPGAQQEDRIAGQLIGPYQILELLGAGGMGRVYRAKDTKLYREVAIKFLSPALATDREHLARFRREAQVLASLNHPNIAAIYSLEESEGTCCLVMELVPGDTLAERLRGGAVALEGSLEIAAGVAEALAAAHQKGVSHRDIKPANIKVTPEGRVKVLDFGLAKSAFAANDSDPAAMTLPGTLLGTPAYMSPEQLRGDPVDHRGDIWAFGCVLYELLTGRRPFSGANVVEVIANVIKTAPEWQALPAATPAKTVELLHRCLEKDVLRRPQDIAEARGALDFQSPRHDYVAAAPPSLRAPVRSLAVLPFQNVSGDPNMEYLGDGLAESIISTVSNLPQLRVMARSAVFRHKGSGKEPQDVGRALGVETVLAGRVLQRGQTLLISAELVDVEGGWQLWGAQYRRQSEDIFAIEEDIAKEIAEKLRLKLAPEAEKLLARRYTENAEAYRLYLQGRFYWAKRTEEGLFKSLQYFRQAIELDPTYALAYAGLAEGYVPLLFYCHMAPKDAAPKALAAARAALEIDPELTEARTVVGSCKLDYEWDLKGAEEEVRAAIKLNPKYSRARQGLADIFTILGRFAEAEAEARIALELDPLALSLNAFMTMTHYFGRQYEKAIDHGRKTVEMDPNFFPGYFYLGLAYRQSGQFAEATAAFEQARTLSNNSTMITAALAEILAAGDQQEKARAMLRELEDAGRKKYVSQVFVAAIYVSLGDLDRAFLCLDAALEDRCPWLARMIRDPRFDSARGDLRYHRLVERMGLAWLTGREPQATASE